MLVISRYYFLFQKNIANFEAFLWSFLSSTSPEIVRGDEIRRVIFFHITNGSGTWSVRKGFESILNSIKGIFKFLGEHRTRKRTFVVVNRAYLNRIA